MRLGERVQNDPGRLPSVDELGNGSWGREAPGIQWMLKLWRSEPTGAVAGGMGKGGNGGWERGRKAVARTEGQLGGDGEERKGQAWPHADIGVQPYNWGAPFSPDSSVSQHHPQPLGNRGESQCPLGWFSGIPKTTGLVFLRQGCLEPWGPRQQRRRLQTSLGARNWV